ncbi:hypothetical protein [Pseudomonas syringae]|uniref:hypothetical protein n=1 Tax=Pseudomonas syringae TaxID=317 RepID=UPI000373CF01|nr:hypothetical protein [Pseudomonas syringae]
MEITIFSSELIHQMNTPISFSELSEMLPGQLVNLSSGRACVFNVVANFAQDSGALLELFQTVTGISLTDRQKEMAETVGLLIAAEGVPHLRSLSDAWGEKNELVEFANAVRHYMIPG